MFIVLNVCTRWHCQVILMVDDVILSSINALHSGNNNNTVYAFDPLIPGNEKKRLWLTLFCEVFGHPHTTQVTSLSRDGYCLLWLHLSNNVSDPPQRPRILPKWGRKTLA